MHIHSNIITHTYIYTPPLPHTYMYTITHTLLPHIAHTPCSTMPPYLLLFITCPKHNTCTHTHRLTHTHLYSHFHTYMYTLTYTFHTYTYMFTAHMQDTHTLPTHFSLHRPIPLHHNALFSHTPYRLPTHNTCTYTQT